MEIFTDHKVEWIIGLPCAFVPGLLGYLIKKTVNIPNITIPFWLLCVLIALIPTYFAVKSYSSKTIDIANKSYGVERVIIDGKHFSNCTFDGTELVFTGKRTFGLSHNKFTAIRFKVEGDAALALNAMIAMYADEAFRPFIEVTFDNIKKEGLEKSAKKK